MSNLPIEEPEITRCVVCNGVCDESGLCDAHKYDEQLAPSIDELLKDQLCALIDKHFPKGKCKERGAAMVLVAEALLEFQERTANYIPKPAAPAAIGGVDELLGQIGEVLTALENAVEQSTVARMNGRTMNNRMVHANAITRIYDLIVAAQQPDHSGCLKRADVEATINAYLKDTSGCTGADCIGCALPRLLDLSGSKEKET